MAADALDYSKTQRIVLLIDLNPLLHLPNSNPYILSLLSSLRSILTFSSLSTSLFAFKLFFSSLSPVLSSSKLQSLLGNSPSSLSFERPSETLNSLSKTLNSLPTTKKVTNPVRTSIASHIASCLLSIVHDYAWDDLLEPTHCDSFVRSNLVLLFSPVRRSSQFLVEFLNLDLDDEFVNNVNAYCSKFQEVFGFVNDCFVSRDIHSTWIDVECVGESDENNESIKFLGLFENAVRGLGWGFCSTDSIVLGSAIVPFGLIYPNIGIQLDYLGSTSIRRKIHGQLNLEITDVSGKPLECNCCDLDFIELNLPSKSRLGGFVHQKVSKDGGVGKTFWEKCGDGIVKMHVKAVQRHDQYAKVKEGLHEVILVCEFSGLLKKESKEAYEDWFADRVLRMLKSEMGEVTGRKTLPPIWQIFMSFLYREGYWGLVSLTNDNGGSCMGVLKPLSVNSALLFMMDNGFYCQNELGGCGLPCLQQLDSKSDRVDIINPNDSQSVSCSTKHDNLSDGQRRKNRKFIGWCQDLSWSSYREAAFENTYMNLEEVYFAKKTSKKLKFLKCWMKQMKKHHCCYQNVAVTFKPPQSSALEIEGTPMVLCQSAVEQALPSISTEEDPPLPKVSGIDDSALASHPESTEAFLSDISNKIQYGLETKEVDLGALAERLVIQSIHWLHQKHEMDPVTECNVLDPKISSSSRVVAELMKLLLQEPKDLARKHRKPEANSQTHELGPDVSENLKCLEKNDLVQLYIFPLTYTSYELQILFRMEIMRSEVAVDIEGSRKQKFVKQICLFLETIQYHLEGGFFGNLSLDKYVERTIKSRYADNLGDVVNQVYTRMDLLPFGEEEPSNLFLNSEDSNQPSRDKPERDEIEGHLRSSEPSTEDAFSRPLGSNDMCSDDNKIDEHDLRVTEAQARRERARRFASFTSWMPDLQRVWAPKQPKASGVKIKSQKQFKRKARRRTSYDVVLETPMTGAKCSGRLHSITADEENQDCGSPSSGSVSKALFQD
ncbi:hypothetical protein RJ641_007649 [Dillenia turbinata]|uniref:Treslin N-terminal domain-containing protein n=1 Tax=Dillenia turbinata TaxID=194707 RepID=A0AAN8V1M0_9MAGN